MKVFFSLSLLDNGKREEKVLKSCVKNGRKEKVSTFWQFLKRKLAGFQSKVFLFDEKTTKAW